MHLHKNLAEPFETPKLKCASEVVYFLQIAIKALRNTQIVVHLRLVFISHGSILYDKLSN